MSGSDTDINGGDGKDKCEDKIDSKGREDLLIKLKSLAIIGEEDDTFDSDTDIESKDNNFSNDIAWLYNKTFSKYKKSFSNYNIYF